MDRIRRMIERLEVEGPELRKIVEKKIRVIVENKRSADTGQIYNHAGNGQPANGARVVFHHVDGWGEKSIVPQGVTGEDGRFVLSTYGTGDGALARHQASAP